MLKPIPPFAPLKDADPAARAAHALEFIAVMLERISAKADETNQQLARLAPRRG